jgi:hypothetical protein
MASPYLLPALGASLLAAVGGGVHLGKSSVGLINPIHFQGPAVHPRDRGAAIHESRMEPQEPAFASLYGWSEGNAARSEDCGDCEAIVARDAYAHAYVEPVRIHRGVAQDWESEPAYSEEGEAVGGPLEEAADYDAELKERIVRYAYYEIEEPQDEADPSDELYAE